MHNQGKYSRIRYIYAVKHHHGNDGEMPRSRSVGGGDDDGERAAHKHDECRQNAQMGGESEAIEGEIEMKEVASPDRQGVKDKEGNIAHAP